MQSSARPRFAPVPSPLFLLLVAWLLGSACAIDRVPMAKTLAPADDATVRARAQLGPTDGFGAYGPTSATRAREAAEFALQLGNHDEAATFAREQLDLARAVYVVAQLTGAQAELASEQLDTAAKAAVAVGDAIHDGTLVLEAGQFLRAPERSRKPLARALRSTREADISWGYANLWRAFERRPRQLAALQRLRWRSHRGTGLPDDAPRLSPEQLADVGPEALDLMWNEANLAALAGRRDDMVRWIDAIVDVDGWDPDALAARAVLDDIERGAITNDAALLPDLATNFGSPLDTQARWATRHLEHPDSAALTLQRATMLLRADAFGDAAQLLAEHDVTEPRYASAVGALEARIALESGTEDGRQRFDRWRRKAGADRSRDTADWASALEVDNAPQTHFEAARAADRRLIAAAGGRYAPTLQVDVLGTTAIDREAPKRTRELGLSGVAGHSPRLAAKVAICRERQLYDADCNDLIEQLSALDDASPAYIAGLDALDGAANVRASWFSPVPWLDAEELTAVSDRLTPYEGTRVAATTDFQTASLFAELAANRPDLASARLQAYGGLLRPETRAVAQMALLDLRDGAIEPRNLPDILLEMPSADVEAAWFIEAWLPGDPSTIAAMFPGPARLTRLARGMALARMGAWQAGAAELAVLVEQLDHPTLAATRATVAARLAMAAELAGASAARDQALAIAEAGEPDSYAVSWVRARVAESAGSSATAHAFYLEALLRRPRSTLALAGALRTLPADRRDPKRIRAALLGFPDRDLHWWASELLEADLDGDTMVALWLAREDGGAALAVGAPAARMRPTAAIGLGRLLEAIEREPLPDQAFPLAAKILDWLAAMPPEERMGRRDLELWLTFLIRPDSELIALAHAHPRVDGVPQPADPTHASLLLAQARREGALDDLQAWALVRGELWEANDSITERVTADLYARAATDAGIGNESLAQYTCLHMFQHDALDLGAERCVPLWNAMDGSSFLAVDLAFLALNRPDLARAGGLDLDAFFARAGELDGIADDPVWLLNASLWASKHGDHETGARMRLRQLGIDPIVVELDDLEYGQAYYRGPELRRQLLDQFPIHDRRRWALAAGSALRGLDLRAADLYADRLLTSLPEGLDDEPAAFTARAPTALAADRAEGETSDAELRSMGLYAKGMTELVRDDLAAGRIDEAGMRALLDAVAEDGSLGVYEAGLAAYPESHVAKLLVVGEARDARARERALTLARELLELHPHSPLVLAEILPLLTGPDDLAAARRTLADARSHNPGHPWLADGALPSLLTGAEGGIPTWLRDPEAFDRQLAELDADALGRLQPRRAANIDTSAEAFFAAEGTPHPDGRLGVVQEIPGADPAESEISRVQFVVREPRASRCEGMACADALITEWTSRDYSLLWARELDLPAGPAIEFVVADGAVVIDNILVPSGGNLFVLISSTSAEDYEAFLPQLALLRRSFRPLDLFLASGAAETLRSAGAKQVDDGLRWRARQTLPSEAAPKATCPLVDDDAFARSWALLGAPDRGELLTDLFLATRAPWQREALLACTKPDAPEAGRLALLALLDGDAAVYAFGHAATAVHHERVVNDARRILYREREPAVSNPALTAGVERPDFGLLQVIAALPDAQAQALTRELLARRNEPRLRAIALAAPATMDYHAGGDPKAPGDPIHRTDVEALREVARAGQPKDALLAVRSLGDSDDADDLGALRDRVDTLIAEGIHDQGERALAVEAAWNLARHLDSRDRKRLSKLAGAVDLEPKDGKPRRAESTRDALEAVVEDYSEGRKLLAKGAPALNDETPQRWARLNQSRGRPRTAKVLGARALAELVPGDEWTFVRVGNAGLFATSLESLLRRLHPSNPADAYLVRTLVHDQLLEGGFALLAEGGGLDLGAPVECASPKGSQSFVCSATIRDRDRVLSLLAERELGDDAGVALPLSLATEFAQLPLVLGALPMVLHGIIEASEEELEPDDSPEVTAERLRKRRVIAGHTLEYYATIQIRHSRLVVDSEHYLVLGDRLLVFSGADMAERVLREPAKGVQPLAEQRAYREATAGWRDGVALQAVDLTEDFGLESMAIELALGNGGLEFSAVGSGPEARDFGQLDDHLPDGAVSRVSLALIDTDLGEAFEDFDLERCRAHGLLSPPSAAGKPKHHKADETCGLVDDDRLPPLAIAQAAKSVALGWYPAEGDSLWQSWVLAMPLDGGVQRAMKRTKLSVPADGSIVEQADLFWVVRDGALAVSTSKALAEAVRDRPPVAGAAERPFARGRFDGQRAAAVMRAMASRYDGERRSDYLRLLATLVGLVEGVEFSGDWTQAGDRHSGRLRATVRLNLAESDEELALIDQWLASPEVGNASKLPRTITEAETRRGLRYRIEVEDAEAFARASIPDDNPRMTVRVTGPNELELDVLPSTAVPNHAKQPLDADERQRMLDSDALIRSTDPEIVRIASDLRVKDDPRATVSATVTWVHERIEYEITPSSLDAVAILNRGEGDCTEYALLTVTLLRAAGIPAELREGMAAGGDEMVAHAWVAWHDGTRWREVDPTAGTDSVSSGHLELEVVDVLAMISLGRFEIHAVEPLD